MIFPEQFLTFSLANVPIGSQVCRILAAAIDAVDPYVAVKKHLSRAGNTLFIKERQFALDAYTRILVVGAGKASVPMADAACEILGNYFTKGIVITKYGYGRFPAHRNCPARLQIIEAGHPLPDDRGVSGTQDIIELINTADEDDLIIVLISGGGSALLTSPAPGITLTDLQRTTSSMLAGGATIQEINSVRKHIDIIKGGQLARRIAPATTIMLALSDVIGDHLDIIASGPTAADGSTFKDALSIIRGVNLGESMPASVISHLNAGADGLLVETPKSGDPIFQNVYNYIIGSNFQAAKAAVAQARREGFLTMLLTNYLQGEAKYVGKVIASIARQAALHNEPLPRPACITLGGETTVTINGDGIGGRNQEMALSAVDLLAGLEQTIIVTLATDGGDGPTDAAGAVITGETCARAKALGMSPTAFLVTNDSYNFFSPLSDLIKTGPTQTNVNDLCLILTY